MQVLLTIVSLIATCSWRPRCWTITVRCPLAYVIPCAGAGSLALCSSPLRTASDKPAFLASCVYIVGMLVGAAFALYPDVLPASTGPNYSLTIYNSAAGHHGLSVGIVWWSIGMVLALVYFIFIYRMFRGKVSLEGGGY